MHRSIRDGPVIARPLGLIPYRKLPFEVCCGSDYYFFFPCFVTARGQFVVLALRCAQPTLKSVLLVINILGDCNRHFESCCVEAIYQICPEHIWLRFVQKKKPSQEKKKGSDNG